MLIRSVIIAVVLSAAAPLTASAGAMSDAAVKRAIVRESINNYPGNCPCPFNTARNGSSCGRRSAYSRAGGYSPICYASDVSAADVRAYREANALAPPKASAPQRRRP